MEEQSHDELEKVDTSLRDVLFLFANECFTKELFTEMGKREKKEWNSNALIFYCLLFIYSR